MIYLDNSATSRFKPQCMFDAMFQQLKTSSNPGRAGHNDSIDIGIKIFETRAFIKQMLNCNEEFEVIFTPNCTEALNLALRGFLPQRTNGRFDVITTANEHNSVLRPLYQIQHNSLHTNVIVVKPQFDGVISPRDIEEKITPYTKLICVCHTSNVTGATSDIEAIGAIANKHGVAFLVDCAQSLGHQKIDMSACHIDFLACAGHKGLHGCQGTGFLVFNKKHSLSPIMFGGTGTNSQSLLQPDIPPECFESGTLNSAGIIGLGASAKWTMENINQISLNLRYLSGELLYGLKQMRNISLYTYNNNGVISFNYGKLSSTDLGDFLNERDIAVRCGLHCAPLIHKHLGTFERGTVRASIGYNNNINDIKALLSAIEELEKQ
ncbi:MAG: aminotransferase class V-fold PLP-dependent enzyme [Clostridia bacterium]